MFRLLIIAVLVALAAAFFLLFLYKVGIIEKMQVKGCKIVAELAKCQFCLSFWSGVLVTFVVSALLQDPGLIIIPLFSTPITRALL